MEWFFACNCICFWMKTYVSCLAMWGATIALKIKWIALCLSHIQQKQKCINCLHGNSLILLFFKDFQWKIFCRQNFHYIAMIRIYISVLNSNATYESTFLWKKCITWIYLFKSMEDKKKKLITLSYRIFHLRSRWFFFNLSF